MGITKMKYLYSRIIPENEKLTIEELKSKGIIEMDINRRKKLIAAREILDDEEFFEWNKKQSEPFSFQELTKFLLAGRLFNVEGRCPKCQKKLEYDNENGLTSEDIFEMDETWYLKCNKCGFIFKI